MWLYIGSPGLTADFPIFISFQSSLPGVTVSAHSRRFHYLKKNTHYNIAYSRNIVMYHLFSKTTYLKQTKIYVLCICQCEWGPRMTQGILMEKKLFRIRGPTLPLTFTVRFPFQKIYKNTNTKIQIILVYIELKTIKH